jgi:hypothetical protein
MKGKAEQTVFQVACFETLLHFFNVVNFYLFRMTAQCPFFFL